LVKKIKNILKKISLNRTSALMIIFVCIFFILIQRLFTLQIIEGSEYADNFTLRTTKERTLTATRGNIYDRNGNLLAYNELSYSITLEDNGTYDTTREKNLTLNSMAYQVLQILSANGDSIDRDFHVIIDESENYVFDVDGTELERFKADVYGHASIEDMKKEEANATADEIMEYLAGSSENRFALYQGKEPYTKEELDEYKLPESLTKAETLDIVIIRYALSTNSYKKYVPVTIASDVNDETVASIMENQNTLPGIDIAEDSSRTYVDSTYFASVIGYTRKASTDELAQLQDENKNYVSTSIIGKAGIEQEMETELQGTNGSETVYVDNLGKVLQIDEDATVEPLAGNDVYLSIDKELQIATYEILEQTIAGIVYNNLIDAKEFDASATDDTSDIRIPIYDVYYALIENNVIDSSHFKEPDASETEQSIYTRFQEKQSSVFEMIRTQMTEDSPKAHKDLDEELREYMDYIVNDLLTENKGILLADAIDKTDATYIAWATDQSISLKEYLTYAASQNWIDISKISSDDTYLDSKEVYESLANAVIEYLTEDSSFAKILYKHMIQNDIISGNELCILLYDQGVLSTDDADYYPLMSGQMTSYDFLSRKIKNLEITPAQLALDPCSGSAVVTDPNTGEILACVSYPGYDNNRLANQMDTDYYNQLLADLSEPLYNKATQQRSAPGSTFKLVSSVAGMTEDVINDNFSVKCTGIFEKAGYSIRCSNRSGHGWVSLEEAIEVSCNVYFNEVAYQLGLDEEDAFSETTSLEKLNQYATMFNLDQNSGIEISEASPQISDSSAIPSYMGQGTHNYTTSQLARYVTTLANSGTGYQLSLLDKVMDSQGNIVTDFTPAVESTLSVSEGEWEKIHGGMKAAISNSSVFSGSSISAAGKTGTAQESKTRPSHGLFIGYAPADNPEIAMAIRIANGYSSSNAALVARDIISYKFNLSEEADILTKTASDNISTERTD